MTRTYSLVLLASLAVGSTALAHPRGGGRYRQDDRDRRGDRDRWDRDRRDRDRWDRDRWDRDAGAGRWSGPWRPQPVELGRIQSITRACQDAMVGMADEQRCVAIASRGRGAFDPTTTIDACEDAMVGNADTLACIARAVDSPRDPVGAIRACEQAMVGDADTLACLGTMTRSWLPASAVGACEQAMVGDANTIACLDALVGTRYDAAQLVGYCDEQTVGDAAAISCIRSWR